MARAPLGSVKNVEGRLRTTSLEGFAESIAIATIKTRQTAEATPAVHQFEALIFIGSPQPPIAQLAREAAWLGRGRVRCGHR